MGKETVDEKGDSRIPVAKKNIVTLFIIAISIGKRYYNSNNENELEHFVTKKKKTSRKGRARKKNQPLDRKRS